MRRRRRLTAQLAVPVGALLLIAACSGSTDGSGSTVATSNPASSTGSSPGASSDTPGPSSATPPSSSEGPKSTEPDLADREKRLDAQSGGTPSVVVTVSGGYEAATYDQSGGIRFWYDATSTTSWQQVGSSRYPASAQVQPTDATVSGALLQQMTHATFIVRGNFTGDGSGNAVAFTTGPNGWGAIIAEKDGNIGPSGHAVGANLIGLSNDFGFVNGHLQTKDCPQNRPFADCGGHQVIKQWQWTGRDFRVI